MIGKDQAMSFDKGNSLDCLDVHAHGTSGSKRWHKPATVVTVDQCGEKRIMKTYPLLFFPLSYCFRLLARHEYKMLKKAEELVFTPNQVRWNANGGGGVCYQYLKGFSLKELQENGEIPKEFFVKLYAAVQQLHQTGMVHLDLGNSGNILMTPSGEPKIIDFGSAVLLKHLPIMSKNWARKKDLLGVLKLWYRFDRKRMPGGLRNYYRTHYKKNLYTPKRFYKALKRSLFSQQQEIQSFSPIIGILALFFGLLMLLSLL
ncbi:RIO1 family regulatory kinase/ATPase [Marinobacter salexigens]|nr:RIO1 family regulatory kinase/ATPase [Marinobacter salexigens]|tara:strand:+ start:21142 stop:21918 length:777 start_codon:yes stop_codon:yes gene_type:complete